MDKQFKGIFNPAIARGLLKMNHPIVDIKSMKENPEKTIFFFEYNEQFEKDWSLLQEKYK